MDMMPVKPERKAQIEEYARLHDQSPEDALDDVLADFFASARYDPDHDETVMALLAGDEDVQAGRTKPAEEVHAAMRRKYGLPG